MICVSSDERMTSLIFQIILCLWALLGLFITQVDCFVRQTDVILVEEETDDDSFGFGAKVLGLFALLALVPVRQPDGTIMPLSSSIGMNMAGMMQSQNQPQVVPIITGPSCSVPECPNGFAGVVNGNCYFRSNTRVSAMNARADCGTRNSVLWEPNTLEEANAVHQLLALGETEVWTGATEGMFGGSPSNPRFQSGNTLPTFAQIRSPSSCGFNTLTECTAISYDFTTSIFSYCHVGCDTPVRLYICEIERPSCP